MERETGEVEEMERKGEKRDTQKQKDGTRQREWKRWTPRERERERQRFRPSNKQTNNNNNNNSKTKRPEGLEIATEGQKVAEREQK